MPLYHLATCLTSVQPKRRKTSGSRMSERSGASTLAAMTLEEPGAEQASPRAPGPLRCGPCAVWPRQQTWLCAVPLVMGFVGLGLSLMLLKWIVVGSVQDYVPTDLVDPKGSIGQDPIFLSKPSAMPKGPDISTAITSAASTTAMVSTTTPLAADGTAPAPRTRSGPPANHSANGSTANGHGNRAPHLHNRVGTRISGTVVTTSTTRATRLTPPSGKEVTPRSTVRKGSSTNGRNGAANSKPGQTSATITTTASTTTASVKTTAKVQPTTSQPAAPVKPTSRWNHGRPGKGPATRPHHRFRTPVAPTLPSLRSEVFKPCVEDKDLAFCLNEGECSIIETVAGVHRHCRCKEGYHGLRCDQFVPKTDAILSDPTDELGIEFMESGDTYQRQVLSIFSIASGICLLGVACMALYRRNKRHREKLQAHFSDSRSLRDCGVNASGLMSKSTPRLQYSFQLQKSCSSHRTSVKGSSVAPGTSEAAPPILSRALSKGKRFRSSSLSLSPAQQQRETNYFRTPPISRGKHKITTNLIDGSRVAGHVYKHLQEDESKDVESMRRCDFASGRVGALLSRTSLSHFAARKGWAEVPCTRLDKGSFLPPSLRTRSVPIIPSLQACDLEAGNVETSDRNHKGLLKWHPVLAGKTAVPVSSSPPYETVVLAPGVMPSSVSPPATTTVTLGSEGNLSSTQTPCFIEITVELAQELKQKSLPSTMKMSGSHSEIRRGGTNTLEAGTVQESGGKSVQYSPRVLHTGSGTRGLKAAGQRDAQGQCQGQTSLVYGGANCSLATKGPSCRGTGNAYAKPSAS
ncbi:LOW QUALITY PROTEIN: pro-neuregulin-3, membrane-bound isoform [Micropterus dolomieu]|uniref:LOW QUALITY PROTEIN: pro-neuregulin-3, membrane-bound isoform n=1 Tax=Micropterus dolomieu TaxID=147949 RepID=UPI001E8D3EC9|nr:LOW QUALITY PROTEIN: pro-neuregulin-3, membrane-bound isoform [Micropterus dolomieu]